MTKSSSHLPELSEYSSYLCCESNTLPGVRVTIRRMSLARRIELGRAVRELAGRLEFHQAGSGIGEQIDAAVAAAEINAVYFRWGVFAIEGLQIDGEPAALESVIASAPEEFVIEIVNYIKRECGISENERKN